MAAYIDLAYMVTFVATYVLDTRSYTAASDADITKSCNLITDIVDELNFAGDKADSDQVNQFPRGTDTSVPSAVEKACAWGVLSLLDGVDLELEFQNLFMVSQAYSNTRSTYDRGAAPAHVVAGVPSSKALRLLAPYLRDPGTVRINRV